MRLHKVAYCICVLIILINTRFIFSQIESPSTKCGGDLRYGEKGAPRNFNPYIGTTALAVQNRLYSMIYEGLVRYDFDSDKILPVLATSWDVSNRNDRLTFHLHNNVLWHDGNKFTANDVKFTFDYLKNRGREQVRRNYSFIRSIVVLNDTTIVFNFTRPTPDALSLFGTWIIPKHRFQNSFDDINGDGALSRRPIGTGPYKFRTRSMDGNVGLLVNRNYWNEKAYIDRIKMRHYPDPSTLINALIFGGVDLVIEVPPNEIARIQALNQFNLIPYHSFSFHAFGYNCSHSILSDPVVRKAFTYAVDREQMLSQWYTGKGYVLFGPFVKTCPYNNLNLSPFPFDPSTARKLLEDAGYSDTDGDNIRERVSDGKEMTFKLIIPVENIPYVSAVQNVAESYRNYLKDIGVRVEVVNLVVDEYLKALFTEHDYDIAWVKWMFGTSYDISSLFYSSDNFPGGNNFINYHNPNADILIKDYLASADKDRRLSIIYRLQEILKEDCPYTFLYTVDNYAAIHYRITNVKIDPFYFFTFLRQWYIPEEFRDF